MIEFAALAPHPPIIIPEIGGARAHDAEKTVQALKQLAQEVAAYKPDTVVFITPHGNVFSDCISYLTEENLTGNMGAFEAGDVKFSYANDQTLLQAVDEIAREQGIPVYGIDGAMARKHRLQAELDHGVMVPLYFLQQAGLDTVKLCVFSVGYLSRIELMRFGRILQDGAKKLGRKMVLISSGDQSHRLKETGPYDFHPDGPQYDKEITQALQSGNLEQILALPETLLDNAGECGYRPLLMLLGALDGYELDINLLSYEGPFGVGYLCATLKTLGSGPSLIEDYYQKEQDRLLKRRNSESAPVRWARSNLESYLMQGKPVRMPEDMQAFLDKQAGVFVSIKKHGQLRGCIGTFLPTRKNIVEEIAANALAAGLNDPRFPSIGDSELEDLVYSVDILEEPEPAKLEDLDPRIYGVIVSNGEKRGLLLPDLEGVETIEQQIRIALQKAGIKNDEPFRVERFRVSRYE